MAERSNAGINTIRMFEAERSKPRKSTLKLLEFTFEEAGVQFTDDNGVGVKLKG